MPCTRRVCRPVRNCYSGRENFWGKKLGEGPFSKGGGGGGRGGGAAGGGGGRPRRTPPAARCVRDRRSRFVPVCLGLKSSLRRPSSLYKQGSCCEQRSRACGTRSSERCGCQETFPCYRMEQCCSLCVQQRPTSRKPGEPRENRSERLSSQDSSVILRALIQLSDFKSLILGTRLFRR